jgi:Uma2 family endonuclease
MATISPREAPIDYPTSDGKPMAETPLHRENMTDTIATLEDWFQADADVYVSGNMLMYYVRGDKRRHVSPDVFVARGIPKQKRRPYYLVWEEGQAPHCVIELTSASTRDEDMRDKFTLYEQTLKVPEYFLFDPEGDYLNPQLQGYRLVNGKYVRIEPVDGRLASEVTGLHLERDGERLRLFDPVNKRRLLTRAETRDLAVAEAQAARAEAERLRLELDELRRRLPD